MSIRGTGQSQRGETLVTLYTIDTRYIGRQEVYNFTASSADDGAGGHTNVVFGGVAFTPIDIEATGFKWDGKGGFPKPRLRISNVGGLVSALVIGDGDIVGSRLTRIRTFARHLDNGENPDPTAMYPPEIFSVNVMNAHTKTYVEWEMASPMEQLGVKIPRRVCIRDVCTHTYRFFDPETQQFDYSNASCPYAGNAFFDRDGVPVGSPDQDRCGRSLSDCKLRFGENAELPTRAFPGILRS